MYKTYYVDNIEGKQSNDGLSKETPIKSYKDVTLQPGDTVLFRSDRTFYEVIESPDGKPDLPITYGAYGEGKKPVISGALSLNNPDNWVKSDENIWKYTAEIPSEVCNVFFDENSHANICWDYSELKQNGWSYTHIGYTNRECPPEAINEPRTLYLFCEDNPAKVYPELKASLFGVRYLATANAYTNFHNLSFEYSGVHGYLGINTKSIRFSNCDFSHIGGAVWQRDRKIRFGNGVEFWNYTENIVVENCSFYNVYDSCVTHQGGRNYDTPKNITIKNNRFSHYGMAAYELRDKITYHTYFTGNICENAGIGLSVQSPERPRNSEIYPQPMGHHIFIWRIEEKTDGGFIEISNNTFGNADYGSAIYSIIKPEPQEQILFKNNVFKAVDNCELIKICGEYISLEEFEKR